MYAYIRLHTQTNTHQRAVNDQVPDADEDEHRTKAHPLCERTRDDGGCDDGKGALKSDEQGLWDSAGLCASSAHDPDLVWATDHVVSAWPVVKRNTVAEDEPQQSDEAGDGKAVHYCSEHVGCLREATVKQG